MALLTLVRDLLQTPAVATALWIGSIVAVVSGCAGVFTVVRGQSFAGHALGDVGSTGAAAAYLTAVQPLYGFLGIGLLGGLAIDRLGNRARERDVATGIVLSLTMGLSALLLFLITEQTSATGGPLSILFGSIFTVAPAVTLPVELFSLLALGLLAVLYRPLVFASLSPETARARGVRVGLVGTLFMVALVIAVEESSLVAGALLSTALLIGPAAAAVNWTRQIGHTLALSAFLGVAAVVLGIVLSYESYFWPPLHRGWPVSFFIVMLVLVEYIASRLWRRRREATA